MHPAPRPSWTRSKADWRRPLSLSDQATYVPPNDDPWQAATQHVRASFASKAATAALTAQLEAAPLKPITALDPGSEAAPPASPPADQHSRSTKVNVGRLGRRSNDQPAWASCPQRETWRSLVLLAWDHERQRIVRLSAQQVLDLLAHFQSCDQWPEEGIVVGIPVTSFVLNQPDHVSEDVLVDQIELSSPRPPCCWICCAATRRRRKPTTRPKRWAFGAAWAGSAPSCATRRQSDGPDCAGRGQL